MTHLAPSDHSKTPRRHRFAPRIWAFIAIAAVIGGVGAASVASGGFDRASNAQVVSGLELDRPIRQSDAPAPGDLKPTVAVPDAAFTDRTALEVLGTLPVKGKAPKTGYDRTGNFGTAWLDIDRNGCDTRNDILARDLVELVRSGPCKVLKGTFTEPYTGKTVAFLRGNDTSTLVQIDHVVALSNGWQTGAQQLTQAQRVSFANDPLNLLAADGRANAQKGDGDAATWLPPMKSIRCSYVARQISVKATYALWVAPAERDAMERVLSACPSEPALASAFVPTPGADPSVPAPAPAPSAAVPAPAPVPPAPEPPASAPAPAVVHPGAYCTPSGALGVTSAGTAMVCGTTTKSPDRARWHRQ